MKKRFLFVMATVLILSMSMVTMISGCGCQSTVTNSTADEASTTATSIETVTEIATDEQGNTYVEEATKIVEAKTDNKSDEKSENKKSESSNTDDKDDSSSSKSDSSSSNNTSNTSNNSSSSRKNNSNSSNKNSSSNNSSSSGKTWHEAVYKTIEHPAETEKVWVVDQEAYSYEEPVYETQWRAYCNGCGADITDCLSAHQKQHALNGEVSNYHTEQKQVQVGTKTVEVPEQGHYETKVIKEAWTEKVLVKEAGYY